MLKLRILEDGEQALIHKKNGRKKLCKGPKRIWLFLSKFQKLDRYNAQSNEFLRIEYKNGEIEHRIGPCVEFLDTDRMKSINVEKCYCLDTNQCLVVYKLESGENYSMKIIRGPGIFMLKPNEWCHTFCWCGNDDNSKVSYVSGKNVFQVLNCAPSQFYYNVNEVRTADDALIRVKLMVFYELKDIDALLKESKDPFGDLLNCCCSDVISFAAKKTYIDFIENCYKLNELSEYPSLIKRSQKNGFEISKVVFRGYFASTKLQEMHDFSIKSRTKFNLELESEEQNQFSQNENLKNEIIRTEIAHELDYKKKLNANELKKLCYENTLKHSFETKLESLKSEKEIQLAKIETDRSTNDLQVQLLQSYKASEVDVDTFMQTSIKSAGKKILIMENQKETLDNNEESQKPFTRNIHIHE